MKGLIALDIDGTLTMPGQPIAQEVINYLHKLSKNDWVIAILTGRPFQWSRQLLKTLPFEYYLSVQNGAITLQMPMEKITNKTYLNAQVIPVMQQICADEPTDFVIYAGYECQDQCFYRPEYFSKELLKYVQARSAELGETWIPVSSFDQLKLEQFPSIKCFGSHQPAIKIAKRIEKELKLHVPLIRDPFDDNYYVAQATHFNASKGDALRSLGRLLAHDGVIIAAGDDYNDLSLLSAATIKVVMSTAPQDMLHHADVIAPPAELRGIIEGLEAAINLKK